MKTSFTIEFKTRKTNVPITGDVLLEILEDNFDDTDFVKRITVIDENNKVHTSE